MDQYKLLLDRYDNEMNRYWTRFNVGLGFQIALLLVLVNGLRTLAANVFLFRLLLLVCLVFSLGFLMVVIRGLFVQKALLRAVATIEKESGGELRLLSLVQQNIRFPLIVNSVVGTVQAAILAVFWVAAFAILEIKGYQVGLPS